LFPDTHSNDVRSETRPLSLKAWIPHEVKLRWSEQAGERVARNLNGRSHPLLRKTSLFLLTLLAACSHEDRKGEKRVTPVRVATVENFTPKIGERYSASIEPDRQATLTFRVSGFVQQLHQIRAADGHLRFFEPGDMVAAGTLLARLRQEDYEIQVKQAQGQLEAARENERAARAQLGQVQAASTRADADFVRAKA